MEFIAKNSKKEIKIVPASFKEALNLKKAVMKSMGQIEILKNVDINNLSSLNTAGLLDVIISSVINIDTSEDFEKAIFECLKPCIYDGFHSITPQLFDDKPEIREDYYEIVSKCAEVNLNPFFKSLVSELSNRFQIINNEDQKQEQL